MVPDDDMLDSYQPFAKISRTSLLATVWALVAIALLFLLARLSINVYAFRQLHVADGFAIFAFALLLANGAVITSMSTPMYELLAVMLGRMQPTPAFVARASYYLKCQFASTILFWTCLWSVKASFLAFFYQLTERLTWPRRVWWAIVAVTTIAFMGSVISYPLSCTSFTVGECSSPENAEKSLISLRLSTTVDILTDVCIIVLPIAMVARIKVSLMRKFGLFTVLSLGVFIIGVAIARVVVTDTHGVHPEISWLALWSAVESSVAVIVCCLASFKVLFKAQHANSQSQPYYVQGSIERTRSSAVGNGRSESDSKPIVLTRVGSADAAHAGEHWGDSSSQLEILEDAADMGSQRVDIRYHH